MRVEDYAFTIHTDSHTEPVTIFIVLAQTLFRHKYEALIDVL